MRRAALAALAVWAVALPAAAQEPPPAPPPVLLTISSVEGDHLWGSDPAFAEGRARFADGQPAPGREVKIEARRDGTSEPFSVTGSFVTDSAGTFRVTFRPRRNLEVRLRPDSGEPTATFRLRAFHRALAKGSGLKRLRDGRERVTEVAAVPPGYRLARAWLYFCRARAKRCTYAARGTSRVNGERMRTVARFRVPRRYRNRSWHVIFRYVPQPGWGDGTATERRRPLRTIPNVDQSGSRT